MGDGPQGAAGRQLSFAAKGRAMIHSSNRLNALSTSGLGSAIQEPDTTFGSKSMYPMPSESSVMSAACRNGQHAHCTKLDCPCGCGHE